MADTSASKETSAKRKALIAMDGSEFAEKAFHCKYIYIFRFCKTNVLKIVKRLLSIICQRPLPGVI